MADTYPNRNRIVRRRHRGAVVTRMWATTALQYGEFAVSGGLVFAGVAWLFGASYGYRAIQDEGR